MAGKKEEKEKGPSSPQFPSVLLSRSRFLNLTYANIFAGPKPPDRLGAGTGYS